MSLERPLLLAGHARRTDAHAEVRAPWDGRLLARVAQAGPEDAAHAAATAARAFPTTRRLPGRQRATILAALAATVRAERERLARVVSDEGGTPRTLARAEVEAAAAALDRAAHDAHQVTADVRAVGGRLALSRAVPRGPVLALTAAAQPLASVAAVLGPAFAAGCPVVVRPAPAAPSAALLVAEHALALGWPPEALSVLPCGDAVAATLVGDPRFSTLHLGRDTPSGAWLAAHLRRRHVLAPAPAPVAVLLEPDAELDQAVAAVARGAYAHAGQVRGWAQRVLVHRDIWDEACARLCAEAARLPRGDPARDDVVCGPLLDRRALARAEAWLAAAEELAGLRLVGGEREGPVLAPTVLAGEAPFFELLDGAPAAPVLVVEPYASLAEAVARVNAHPLRADVALFTRSVAKVWEVFETLEARLLVHDAHPDALEPPPGEPRATLDGLLSPRTLRIGLPGTPPADPRARTPAPRV